MVREWHAAALGVLHAAGWGRLTAHNTTFLQRLGFGLPPRPLPVGGAPARSSLRQVRDDLVDAFAGSFGRWMAEDETRRMIDLKPGARGGATAGEGD